MIKTILVATDASKHGKKAVKISSELARSLKARLVIVHTLLFDAHSSSLRKIASRQGLTRDQRHLLDSYEIDTQLTLAAAKKEKADLLVMGTRGYGELKGLFLGSVSHKVSAQAHCPVLTVK
jgi:nucleotide-binding universal stress UspA family protein